MPHNLRMHLTCYSGLRPFPTADDADVRPRLGCSSERSMEFLSRFLVDAPAALLSWLGRQGTRAVAALIVIGIAMPPIGALLKPFVTEAAFMLLCIAFLRVGAKAFRSYFGRPMIVLAATACTSLVIPALFVASYLAFGLKHQTPDLFLDVVL